LIVERALPTGENLSSEVADLLTSGAVMSLNPLNALRTLGSRLLPVEKANLVPGVSGRYGRVVVGERKAGALSGPDHDEASALVPRQRLAVGALPRTL
jgi:hypothetical protein